MTKSRNALQLSGFTDPDGNLLKPSSPTDRWAVPSALAQVRPGAFVATEWEGGRREQPSSELLHSFIGLREASDELIQAFAARWGLLFHCEEHGLPFPTGGCVVSVTTGGSEAHGFGHCTLRYEEVEADGALLYAPVEVTDDWRALANELDALVQLIAQVSLGTPAATTEVARLNLLDPPNEWREKLWASGPKRQAAEVVNGLCDLAGLRWQLDWRMGQPKAHLSTSSLFAGLCASLQAAVTRNSVATCSACGRHYEPSRKPNSKNRNYCPDCRSRGVPVLYAKRAQRERQLLSPESERGQ